MKLWDDESLATAMELLTQSTTVAEAAEKISKAFGRYVSVDALRAAFLKRGMGPPSSHLGTNAEDNDVNVTPKKDEAHYEHHKSYFYDKGEDIYYITLKSWRAPLKMHGDDVRAIQQAWSNFGGTPSTRAELSRKYGLRQQTIVDLLKALDIQHTSGPYTDEVLEDTDEDELVEDAVKAKEERVLRKAEKRNWERILKRAEQAESFDQFVMDRIENSPLNLPPLKPAKIRLPNTKRSKFSAVATPTDLHVGKHGWIDEVGDEYNIQITRSRLVRRTTAMIEDVLEYGQPEEWIVGAGSDWFHIDNDQGLTTKGTPQDTDGTFARILQEGCKLAEDYIQMLRQVAPVKIVLMAGNHDKVCSLFLMLYLEAVFRSADDVEVTICAKERQYLQCGKTLVGITHGDGAPLNQLPLLMAQEAKKEWAECSYSAWFTGHKHHHQTTEQVGTLVFQMPSLAGTDRWHYRKGYVGSLKSLNAYIIDHQKGVKGVLMSVEDR